MLTITMRVAGPLSPNSIGELISDAVEVARAELVDLTRGDEQSDGVTVLVTNSARVKLETEHGPSGYRFVVLRYEQNGS